MAPIFLYKITVLRLIICQVFIFTSRRQKDTKGHGHNMSNPGYGASRDELPVAVVTPVPRVSTYEEDTPDDRYVTIPESPVKDNHREASTDDDVIIVDNDLYSEEATSRDDVTLDATTRSALYSSHPGYVNTGAGGGDMVENAYDDDFEDVKEWIKSRTNDNTYENGAGRESDKDDHIYVNENMEAY